MLYFTSYIICDLIKYALNIDFSFENKIVNNLIQFQKEVLILMYLTFSTRFRHSTALHIFEK